MRYLFGFVLFLLALGTLRTVGCGDESPCGDCNDGNPCTIDQCSSRRVGEPPGMCEPDERPVVPYCSNRAEPDGTPCGGGNGVSGVCIDGVCDLCEGVVCDDGNECTRDCNPATGTCDYIPVQDGTKCDDGDDNDCAEDICIRGACTGDGTPVTCDDGRECTEDTCEPPEGCVATPVDDGTTCGNGAATCQAGNCVGVFACTEQGIRDAIEVGDGPHTFDCEGPTVVVTEATIVIDNDVILDGEGDLTIDANRGHKVLTVFPADVTAELRGVAVTGGLTTFDGGGILNHGTLRMTNSTVSGNTNSDGPGGGIFNWGTLTLTNSTVSGNTTSGSGGGIRNDGSGGGGTLRLTNSTVSGNTAYFGGGIANAGARPATLTNSTVSGNTASGSSGVTGGGGIYNAGGGTLTLTNSTVSGNTSLTHGSGIYNVGGGTLTLINSTISANSVVSSSNVTTMNWQGTVVDGACVAEHGATTTSNGYNIESAGDTCGFDQTGDQVGRQRRQPEARTATGQRRANSDTRIAAR